jgi:hypothetical protein
VDAEGARALAARIAAGRPVEEAGSDPPSPAAAKPPRPRAASELLAPATAASPAVEIVYIKPIRVTPRDVRIYVRRRDGRFERSDS